MDGCQVVCGEKPAKDPDGSLLRNKRDQLSVAHTLCNTDLERIETGVGVERQLREHPVSSSLVFLVESHQQKRVERVDDGISYPTRLGEVRPSFGQRVELMDELY